uniref:Uncharacterized protein n=1 Tax=Cucumis sativus TaxID=3659 RepID=A0A0A0M328_CUCSA
MEAYFTKIKTLWQDLYDFRPIDECSCGAAKSLFSYLEPEYVMIFFMGFNETYASTHAQILLMDPLPSISNTPQPRRKSKKYCRSIISCCYEIIEREIASDKTILKFVCHELWIDVMPPLGTHFLLTKCGHDFGVRRCLVYFF